MDPFDPLTMGVEPLQSMEAMRTPRTVVPPNVNPNATSTAPSDNSDAARELIASVLLSLGSIGGQKPPQFLMDTLRDRATIRRQAQAQEAIAARQQATEERKAQRVRDVGGFIARAQELEANGDIPGAMVEARKGIASAEDPALLQKLIAQNEGLVKAHRAAAAVDNAIGMLLQTDPQKPLTDLEATQFAFSVALSFLRSGLTTAASPEFIKTIKEAAQGVVKEHILSGPGGQSTLLRTRTGPGPAVETLATQPGMEKLPTEHGGVIPAPPVQIPGAKPVSQAPVQPGSIQPVGSGVHPMTGEAPSGFLISPSGKRLPLTNLESRLLAGTPWENKTYMDELGTAGRTKLNEVIAADESRRSGISFENSKKLLGLREKSRQDALQAKAEASIAVAETNLTQIESLIKPMVEAGFFAKSPYTGDVLRAQAAASRLPGGRPADPILRTWMGHEATMVQEMRTLGDIGSRAKNAYESTQRPFASPWLYTEDGARALVKQIRTQLKSARTHLPLDIQGNPTAWMERAGDAGGLGTGGESTGGPTGILQPDGTRRLLPPVTR